MIILTIATMLAAASADTSASAERSALSNCLKETFAKAKSAKVEVAGFDSYVRSQCAAQEAALREAVIAIDRKNGISRKDAAENADLDVGDYFLATAERYEAEMAAMQPRKEQAQAQVPAQAQAPQEPSKPQQ